MYMRLVKILMIGSLLSLTATSTPQQTPQKLSPQTREHLMTAMRGEAFAYAKYMAYAQRAREDGLPAIADLFEQTARVEHLEHFREMAELAHLAGSDAQNLEDAIHGETQESQTIYPKFAEDAAAVGDTIAAERFREISKDEMKHRDMFQNALASLIKKEKGPATHSNTP
jgi:rubrerythrin